MDNYMKENKNRYLLVSFVVDEEEVKLGFLVVGHTHEDIDGCFGYLSKMLKE
jgi:CO dehydrogenase nickel-insertion accessory protein CooC1